MSSKALLILSFGFALSVSSCTKKTVFRKQAGQKKVAKKQDEMNHMANEAEEITSENKKEHSKEEKQKLKDRKEQAKKEVHAGKKSKKGKKKKINNGIFNFF